MYRTIAAIAAIAAIAVLAVAGCNTQKEPAKRPKGKQPEAKRYTRAEFGKLIEGKDKAAIGKMLGKPDESSGDPLNEDFWVYRNRTLNETTGRPNRDVKILFRRNADSVLEVTYR